MTNPLTQINCKDHKNTLDSMIRRDKKGSYHCVDCETDEYNLQNLFTPSIDHKSLSISPTKATRLMGWLLG